MSRTTEAGNYPEEEITTPGGYTLRGTVWPDGCTRWASHVPCRHAFSIAFFTYEQQTWQSQRPAEKTKRIQSDVKGYWLRPRYVVYKNSSHKRDFKTQGEALAYIDELRGES